MKKWLILGVLLAAGALTSCGLDVGFKPYYKVNLTPDAWGFAVQNGELTVVGNLAQVLVSPGAPEGVLERVEVHYLDGAGQEIDPGDSTYTANVSVPIPPGIVCPASDGGTQQCTKSSADWEYGWALSEPFEFSLDGKIAAMMYQAFLNNANHLDWHARVVFYARTSGGRAVQWEQDIKILFPLEAQ
ncbi:hypothetical protein [Oceanithermus profundus]|uniref:Lipoprotein n=1 Tax=Oceanithermus profundus (strain DSM 14977 / NBRC 100410 / VKM B-2274 / 506) TaxID=670487 RepID=E4U4Q5_OCEP5|nr:hypothetical protein [Oceanithermus profundus]ADR37122.1 hypothetical protein Ocepr_1669 [Oceanithermus profundus DSM 14977]